jgi:hypothetical protein
MSNDEVVGFESETAVRVDFRSDPPVQEVEPFVYFDNSNVAPLALPQIDAQLNQIPAATLGIGYAFGGLAMVTAVGWLVWTFFYRKADIVRISQPIFLGQLCVGAFILAAAIIPMSFQEPMSHATLDFGCMATPWFLSLGFVTAFSALFSKVSSLLANNRQLFGC